LYPIANATNADNDQLLFNFAHQFLISNNDDNNVAYNDDNEINNKLVGEEP